MGSWVRTERIFEEDKTVDIYKKSWKNMQTLQRFEVKPKNRNYLLQLISCLFILLLGLSVFAIGVPITTINVLCALVLIVFGGVGLFSTIKALQRTASMVLDRNGLHQMTVVGTAMIPWQDIETIGSTRIQAHKMIGIRLKKYDGYINNMSSELADLINKSLPLVRLASIGISFLNIPIYAKALAAFEGRENPARTLRKIGRVGNLAESMIFCRQTYGYDILFAWTELDRPASEFIKLLESYRTAWSSLESAPHKPFGSQWNPGQPHPNYPNVIASKEEGKWHPAPGYNWMDVQKNLQVKWFPGQPHRNYPNVIASQKEGEWLAAPGYEWANPTDAKDLQVVWSPGQNHPKYPSVIAGDDEKWYPAPGYKWVDVQKDLRVVWEPGQVHREHPNLVSGQKEGEWQTSTTENNRTASSSQSEKLITVCPICSQKLRAPIDRGILTLSCPKCNHSWRWSPSSGRL